MIAALLRLRPQITSVLDIGAGDGRLLQALRPMLPGIRLTGVDLRPRPAGLTGIDWQIAGYDTLDGGWRPRHPLIGSAEPTMIICAEWLDDLPCPIAVRQGDRWCEVLVHPDGSEEIGDPCSGIEADWLHRWWPVPHRAEQAADGFGIRAEVGSTRDRAWAGLIFSLRDCGGAALMIDYGHLMAGRPVAGSLTSYASGRQLRPRPDPAINLTADVAIDAIAAAGAEAGARTALRMTQRQAVERLLGPDEPEATTDQTLDPLRRLQERSERHAIGAVLGHHWWLLQDVPPADPGVASTDGRGGAD